MMHYYWSILHSNNTSFISYRNRWPLFIFLININLNHIARIGYCNPSFFSKLIIAQKTLKYNRFELISYDSYTFHKQKKNSCVLVKSAQICAKRWGAKRLWTQRLSLFWWQKNSQRQYAQKSETWSFTFKSRFLLLISIFF